jgi:histidine decarboxylase
MSKIHNDNNKTVDKLNMESCKMIKSNKIEERLDLLYQNLINQREESLGYPINQVFDYSILSRFLNIHLNNIGDPFVCQSTLLNTKELEQEVLEYFAVLWNGKNRKPLTRESYWGYMLGMGATEGTMYALWNARDYLCGKPLIHDTPLHQCSIPLLYCSQETHYSIAKCATALRIPSFYEVGRELYPGQCPITSDGHWPCAVPSHNGSIDPSMLAVLVAFFLQYNYSPIIVLNLGSTFKGAFDDPEEVWRHIEPVLQQYNSYTNSEERQNYWIHMDGALGAAYLPYLEIAKKIGLSDEQGPLFDFRLPYICSIIVSSHKWFGSPLPGGVYMSKEKFRLKPVGNPDYIRSPDTTFSGSRHGFSTLILWYALMSVSVKRHAQSAAQCVSLAAYAQQRFSLITPKNPSFWVTRLPQSLNVLFPLPCPAVFNKFHLSSEKEMAHIVVMPHVTSKSIDLLAEDLELKL